jgi:hypothetical protein
MLWSLACADPEPAPLAGDSGDQPAACEPYDVEELAAWEEADLPANYDRSHTPAGVALGDLDGDGWLDAVMAYGGGSPVLMNDGAGTLAIDETRTMDGTYLPRASSVAMVDLDGDGDLDVYLGRDDGEHDLLLSNDGAAHFTSTRLTGSEAASTTGAFADFDLDGRLDLFVASTTTDTEGDDVLTGATTSGDGNALYIQQADGTLVKENDRIPAEINDGWSFHGAPIDADGDGDLDIYLANDFGAWIERNHLMLNDGTGHFEDAPNCGCDLTMFGMGAAVGDADGDGAPDLYISDIGGPNLLLNLGDGTFYDATLARSADIPAREDSLTSWGTGFADLDQDTWPDIAITFGQLGQPEVAEELSDTAGWVDGAEQPDVLLLADGSGGFTRPTTGFADPSRTRAVAFGDMDRDGTPDLVTAGKYFLRQWHASGGCEPGVTLELDGPTGNRQGIGARIRYTAGGRTITTWMLPSTTASSSAPELYLGLGGRAESGPIEVLWPDGVLTITDSVPAGTRLVVTP